MRKFVIAAAACLLLTLHGVGQNVDDIAAAGTFDGQRYVNKSLGLSILAPGGWTFFPYSRNAALVEKNRAGHRDLAAINTQVLFQATPPRQFGGESSAIFSAGIHGLSKTMTTAEYANASSTSMAKGNVTLSKGVTDVKLGSTVFSTFEVTGTVKSAPFRQVFFVTVRNNIAIFFVETFYDNKNTFATEASLKTLRFR